MVYNILKGKINMEIKEIYEETVPSSRFIGKKDSDWGLFWEDGWCDILKKIEGKSKFNYITMKRVVNGNEEYWVGTLFNPDTPVPEGLDFVDFESFRMAVFRLYGKSNELYDLEAHNQCLAKLSIHGFTAREDCWCIVRPRYSVADGDGNVIMDYYISIE
jgi:hypothetical protein